MIPSNKQWAKWSLPSKLTAIGTYNGIFSTLLAVIALVITVISMSSSSEEEHLRKTLFDIQSEVSRASLVAQSHPLESNFLSSDGAIQTLDRLNDFGVNSTTSFNYVALSNLLKEYANEDVNLEFKHHLNNVHNTSFELSQLVLNVINSEGPASNEELDKLNKRYLELLNIMLTAYSDYHTFVVNIKPSDIL